MPLEDSVRDYRDPPRWLVIGLGNPGPEYEDTYHNVGFRVVDRLAGRMGKAMGIRIGEAQVGLCPPSMILVKPQTYMNASGRILGLLFERFGEGVRLCVVSDDLALPCGRVRVRERGSAGGHNGLKSISSAYGSNDYVRVRVGIGTEREFESTKDYVLSRVSRSERDLLSRAEVLAADAVECVTREGVRVAMSRYNGMDLRENDEGRERDHD